VINSGIKNRYTDLIHQTFFFPRHGFEVIDNKLHFHGVDLMALIKNYNTPLKFTYLPKITSQINKARELFNNAIKKYNYNGSYTYCYCTKSSHFSFVINQALKAGVDLETSSAFDLNLVEALHAKGNYSLSKYIICNGYKTTDYVANMAKLINRGFNNLICILDNPDEIDLLDKYYINPAPIGIRIATEEEPNYAVYTSRIGMSYKKVIDLYEQKIKNNKKFNLKMLHFFVNSGIRDTSYYWSELTRMINIYCDVKEVCPTLTSLDIGGGMPIYTSLGVEYDYEYMIDQIVYYIKTICDSRGVAVPDIFTEFGSFTVGESGGTLYSIIGTKEQNDKENWYMIDSSLITTLPDTWGIGQKFIMLAINHWDKPFQRINLGGITCDSQDFYNSDVNLNQVFLPKINKSDETLCMGFFHTGAYQESLAGYGGIQHCLIPAPKHIIINRNADNELTYEVFANQQNVNDMLNILGY